MDYYTRRAEQEQLKVTGEQIQAAKRDVACIEQRDAQNRILWEDEDEKNRHRK